MANDPRAAMPGAARVGRPSTARIQQRRDQVDVDPIAEALAQADDEVPPRGGAVPERLVRRRSRAEDKFYIAPGMVPPGWSYEWKRKSVYGQPDTDHQTNLRENYWKAVPASRHPHMMPLNDPGPIEKDGMVLMERPAYLTEDARDEDYAIARGELQRATAQIGQTPGGTMTRDHPSVQRIAKVRHSYGPVDAES